MSPGIGHVVLSVSTRGAGRARIGDRIGRGDLLHGERQAGHSAPMNGLALLTLKLASELGYCLENFDDGAQWDFGAIATRGIPDAEGRETVLLFDPDSLVRFDEADGPRLLAVPGRPGAYGVSGKSPDPRESGESREFRPVRVDMNEAKGESVGTEDDGMAPRIALAPGLYAFTQWRAPDAPSLMEGIEYFAREIWWEGVECRGPWILRRVAEDGRIATQLLVRMD